MGGEKGTPGIYCLRMCVIKRLLLCNTMAVTNLMGWVLVVTQHILTARMVPSLDLKNNFTALHPCY